MFILLCFMLCCHAMKVLVLKAPKERLEDVDPFVVALQEAGMVAAQVDVLSFQYTNKDVLQQKLCSSELYGGKSSFLTKLLFFVEVLMHSSPLYLSLMSTFQAWCSQVQEVF